MRVWGRILVVAFTCSILFFSCVNSPTKPKPGPGTLLYVSEFLEQKLLIIDAEKDSIIDSITQILPDQMIMSNDSRYLYLVDYTRTRDEINRIDLMTHNIEGISTGAGIGGEFALLDRGSRLVRATGKTLEHIDPVSMEIIDVDSVYLKQIAGSDTVSFIIGLHTWEEKVVCYNYRAGKIVAEALLPSTVTPHYPTAMLSLAPDGRTGYIIVGRRPCSGMVIGFETPSLEVFYTQELGSCWGEAVPSPDGKYVVFTDPGSWGRDNCRIGDIFIFDIAQRRVVKTIRTGLLAGNIEYSRDGRFAYIANHGTDEGIEILDMTTLELVDRLDFSRGGIRIVDFKIGIEH